jgi:Zn-dependent metalloprotease
LELIRKEPVEAWKKTVQESRVSTIENKKMLVSEIMNFEKSGLKIVRNSVQNRKLAVNAEIKSKFDTSVENWKQSIFNKKAVQLFNKHIMLSEITKTSPTLKKTQTIEQTKTSLMQAIRAKTNTSPVPEWQEIERIERSTVQNQRNLVLSHLRSVKPVLGETKSLEQVRIQLCKEIRALKPIEAWKEKEREVQAGLYADRRMVMQAIANGVSSVENKKSQAELKDAMLVEIRSKGDFAVPEWKEKRMSVRANVLKNKVALNAQICARKVC